MAFFRTKAERDRTGWFRKREQKYDVYRGGQRRDVAAQTPDVQRDLEAMSDVAKRKRKRNQISEAMNTYHAPKRR